MVDFDNEATVGTPAVDIERVSILQRRFDLLEALEGYNKNRFRSVATDISIVKARVLTFFYQLQGMLVRKLKPEEYKKLKDDCHDIKDIDTVLSILEQFNVMLDGLRLTRIDTRKQIDYTRVEEENKEQGY